MIIDVFVIIVCAPFYQYGSIEKKNDEVNRNFNMIEELASSVNKKILNDQSYYVMYFVI